TAYAQDPPPAEPPPAEASGSVSLSTDSGASADSSASAAAPAPAPAAAPAPAEEEPYEPYEPGLPPEGNVLELGVFGGMIIPSPDHNLRYEAYPQREYQLGGEGGGRLGYYPLSFLGIEGEIMAAGSKVEDTNNQGVLYAYRGSLVLQIPTPYIAPFL